MLIIEIFLMTNEQKENLKFSDLELIFKDLKSLFDKRIYYKLESIGATEFR